MSKRVTLRTHDGRAEEIYLSTNADEHAAVQMVFSTDHASLFIDLTLEEARSFKRQLDAAIAKETKRQARFK